MPASGGARPPRALIAVWSSGGRAPVAPPHGTSTANAASVLVPAIVRPEIATAGEQGGQGECAVRAGRRSPHRPTRRHAESRGEPEHEQQPADAARQRPARLADQRRDEREDAEAADEARSRPMAASDDHAPQRLEGSGSRRARRRPGPLAVAAVAGARDAALAATAASTATSGERRTPPPTSRRSASASGHR